MNCDENLHRRLVYIDLRRTVVEAVAVGSLAFVEKVKSELEFKAAHRQFER